MINDKNQDNFEPQKRASPDGHILDRFPFTTGSEENSKSDAPVREKEQFRGEVKKLDAVMLDSESIISPVIDVKETPKASSSPSIFTAQSLRNKNRLGSFLNGKRQLLFGLLIGFLLSSVLLAAFLLNSTRPDTAPQQKSPDLAEAPNSTESETVSDEKTNSEGKEQKNELTVNDSKPLEKISSPSRVRTLDDKGETKINDPLKQQTDERPDSAAKLLNEGEQTDLHTLLNEWIEATNNRNFDKQMIYYAPQVKSYYRSRNASIRDIRVEKQRVFSETDSVDIQAGRTQIYFSPDGQTATMRFRKKYIIKKGQDNRNGEVLQELKWVKSRNGWKIVSERDLRVLN